jgi:outer membrane protein OmpA-like peptidoglycan-associated protein
MQGKTKNIVGNGKIARSMVRFNHVIRYMLCLVFSFSISFSSVAQSFSIYFETDKSTITGVGSRLLDSLIGSGIVDEHDSLFIACHCDNRADSAYNYALSIRRAKSVKRYLIKNGIGVPIRLYGYGEAKPDYPNTADTRFKNRRCDVVFAMKSNEREISIDDIGNWEEGSIIRLDGLEFVGNQAIPNYYSMPVLYKVLEVMLLYPTLKIRINGHVCCGNNLPLSIARARAVYDYLSQNGIDTARIQYRGFSNTKPLVEEVDALTQQRNRRVEIEIVNKPLAIDAGQHESIFDFFVPLRDIPFRLNTHILSQTAIYNLGLIAGMIANSNGYAYVLHVYAENPALRQKRLKTLQNLFRRESVSVKKLRIKPGRDVQFNHQDILILEVNQIDQ